METYDTRGGSPISPNEPDFAPSKLVEDVLAVLEVSGAPAAVSDKVVALIEAAEALASSPSQPAGWKLDEEQAALLRDTIGEQASPITLSVGPVTDDDGKTETGLRVHLSEYPEEGAILLAAAPALVEGKK